MLTLLINMRLHADITFYNRQYADWLSKHSYDPSWQGDVSFPAYVSRVSQREDLYERVFPRDQLHDSHYNPDLWRSRATLTPFRDSVAAMEFGAIVAICRRIS